MVGGGWMHLDEPPRQNKGEQGNERTNDHHLVIAHGCRHGLEQSGTGQSSKLSCGPLRVVLHSGENTKLGKMKVVVLGLTDRPTRARRRARVSDNTVYSERLLNIYSSKRVSCFS